MTNIFVVQPEQYATAAPAEQCCFNRINAMACICAAGRGWIGASFSCAEILTALYGGIADLEHDRIVLGKGHAAAMQYACLAGAGILPIDQLLKYKQADGPQAHTDIATPGIAVNTGSLGQALSKCCGLAMGSEHMVYAILGDGELQEGQNFEAFQTIRHYGLRNLVTIIDRNRLQSDSNVVDIMGIHDLDQVLAGFGLNVLRVNGNDLDAVTDCLRRLLPADKPTVVVAETTKGAGVSFMAARDVARRDYTWHGGVPSETEYRAALQELRSQINGPKVAAELDAFLAQPAAKKPAKNSTAAISTGQAFADELVRLAPSHPELRVLDADLEKSCKLTTFAEQFPDQFIEMGIAEQDMVSCAGGLALRGLLPVVNTYASFFRRAYEQIYVNATEKTKIVYAGHYAGLCYAPDGKTHQCTGDIAMMRAIPGMHVLYPASIEEIPAMLDWYLQDSVTGPLYIRLHRKAPATAPITRFRHGYGSILEDCDGDKIILTSGPHMAAHCLPAAEERGFDLYAVSTLRGLSPEFVDEVAEYTEVIHVIEESYRAGGLLDEFCHVAATAGIELPELTHHAVDDFTFSTLEDDGLYRHFDLDRKGIDAKLDG